MCAELLPSDKLSTKLWNKLRRSAFCCLLRVPQSKLLQSHCESRWGVTSSGFKQVLPGQHAQMLGSCVKSALQKHPCDSPMSFCMAFARSSTVILGRISTSCFSVLDRMGCNLSLPDFFLYKTSSIRAHHLMERV